MKPGTACIRGAELAVSGLKHQFSSGTTNGSYAWRCFARGIFYTQTSSTCPAHGRPAASELHVTSTFQRHHSLWASVLLMLCLALYFTSLPLTRATHPAASLGPNPLFWNLISATMTTEDKDKDAISDDVPHAEHRDFPSRDDDDISKSPTRDASNDTGPVTHKMTTHGQRELVPQPSDDPRDPLVSRARQVRIFVSQSLIVSCRTGRLRKNGPSSV